MGNGLERMKDYWSENMKIDLKNAMITGITYLVVSLLVQYMRESINASIRKAILRSYVSVTVESTDSNAYDPILNFLNSILRERKDVRHLTVVSNFNKEQQKEFVYIPNDGTRNFMYKGRSMYMKLEKDSTVDLSVGGYPSRIILSMYGNSLEPIREFIDDAEEYANMLEKGKLVIHICKGGYWKKFGVRDSRPINSVILEENVKENIIADIEEFFSSESRHWYQFNGIGYRRTYLLYGPPGCGKTSLVKAIAGVFNLSISVLSLNDDSIDDSNINTVFNTTPPNSIVLIEDIDAAITNVNREDAIEDHSINSKGLTLGGLLNALDGVASQEGRTIFLTTNKKLKLDPALIRSGRVDRKFYIGRASASQAKKLFKNFFPAAKNLHPEFTSQLEPYKYSMADIQKYLMYFKKSPEKAIKNLQDIDTYLEYHHTEPQSPKSPTK